MAEVDQRALRAAAEVYSTARREYEAATAAADAAYERLQASPETFEYRGEWLSARRHEAEVASRLKHAEETYRLAGGYLSKSGE